MTPARPSMTDEELRVQVKRHLAASTAATFRLDYTVAAAEAMRAAEILRQLVARERARDVVQHD